MNMFMPWVDIKTNKESMIPTLTLIIQDGGFNYGNQTQVAPPPFDNRSPGFQQRVQQPYQAW